MRIAIVMALAAGIPLYAVELAPTPGPHGPYHVAANRILDREGKPYLIRGTELAPLSLDLLRPHDWGELSATALVTIRQRLNMNAVRLPIPVAELLYDGSYRVRTAEIVRTANRLDLLVVISASGEARVEFWTRIADMFRDDPNVFFAAGSPQALQAIRAAGAPQPAIVDAGAFPLSDGNVIYETTGDWRAFTMLAQQAPLLVSGQDPHLSEDSAACRAFPADPTEATRFLSAELDAFDTGGVSWILSAFRPGYLITDTYSYFTTKLDDGWTCGHGPNTVGLGMMLLSHLWRSDPHGLFVVNGDSGGYALPRGGRATAYGPTLADREEVIKPGQDPPFHLANISVRVTDAFGVAHMARMLYTGAGWAQLTFLVPDDAAPGPAEIAVVRSDGSISVGHSIIDDVAPGLHAATMDGRGPAHGLVTQRLAHGFTRTFGSYRCAAYDCRTLPIPLAHGVDTTVRLVGTGFRHAPSLRDLKVMVGGVEVPVLSYGPLADNPGSDQVTIRLTDRLIGKGEQDLWMNVAGRQSDVMRIYCGESR
jgi:uncharacterized protein (TIGR03437 family)